MYSYSYFETISLCKSDISKIEARFKLVRYAQEFGIRSTVRVFGCSKNTVKRWLRRYIVYGKKGLVDLSKRPHNFPKQLDQLSIDKIFNCVKEKKNKKCFISSVNVKRKTKVSCSYVTCNKYVKLALGNRKRNTKKDKTNGGCLDFKKDLKPFDLFQIDIKYLTDIESLKPYFRKSNDRLLAKYQFTFRDVCSGLALVAFGDEKSETLASDFLKKVIVPFLSQFPNHKEFSGQTDNGKEFTNKDVKTYRGDPVRSEFTKIIESYFSKHNLIIPGHCTAQSEVESFHWCIERDCLAWDDISDNESLLFHVNEYLTWFNNKKRFNCDFSPIDKIKSFYNFDFKIPKAIIL